jgi:hypothetical protein
VFINENKTAEDAIVVDAKDDALDGDTDCRVDYVVVESVHRKLSGSVTGSVSTGWKGQMRTRGGWLTLDTVTCICEDITRDTVARVPYLTCSLVSRKEM